MNKKNFMLGLGAFCMGGLFMGGVRMKKMTQPSAITTTSKETTSFRLPQEVLPIYLRPKVWTKAKSQSLKTGKNFRTRFLTGFSTTRIIFSESNITTAHKAPEDVTIWMPTMCRRKNTLIHSTVLRPTAHGVTM